MDDEPKQAESRERLRELVLDLELAKARERELREEATALLAGLSAITDATSPEEVIERVLAALRVPFAFDAAFVLRPREAEGVLVVETATDPLFHGVRFPVAKVFERALRGRVTTQLDTATAPEWLAQSEAIRARVGSVMCLPLQGERERALIVFTHSAARAFQPRHEQLARRFLPLATQALRDAERRAQVTEANRSMRLVLDNVAQGLLTVGRDRVVAAERSAVIDRWFGAVPPGATLDDLVARKDAAGGTDIARLWSELLDSPATDQRLAALPRRLECSGLTLHIDYRPVPSPESWQHMLVVISDVSVEVERARLALAAKDAQRLSELSIAQKVQTSLLPRDLCAPGLEVAARMLAAEEVGGDYYDVIPVEGGCWLGIGDVTGHGLSAGLIMLMVQSALGALVRGNPTGSPRQLLIALNAMLFDNIRRRLGDSDHVTLSLVRCDLDGQLAIAGAHESPIVYRAATGHCEILPTTGTWAGIVHDVARFMTDDRHRLEPGDTLWLYTDGLIEARESATGEHFELDRVCRIIEESRGESIASIRDRIFDALRAWSPNPLDDVAIVGARYTG